MLSLFPEVNITLTLAEAQALLEGWEIEECVPTDAFGPSADAMERADDYLVAAKEKLRAKVEAAQRATA